MTQNNVPQPPLSEEDVAGTSSAALDFIAKAAGADSDLTNEDGHIETEPPVRGEVVLRFFERGFLAFDRLLARALPKEFNPFLNTGAIAVVAFFVAAVTGVILLLWYKPSVVQAYSSVAAMADSPFTAGLMRSLHRYSSDLCMFFALVHAVRLFFERRFVGSRWLAWVTGMLMLALLWFIGWSGYWLVWDERAQHIAVGTARALDVLPIFADPMGRTLLVNETVNSLLFFVVFFVHMLIPLAFGVAAWLHLARLSRPQFLTQMPLSIWVAGTLLLLSIFYPAQSAEQAHMTALGRHFTMDTWYLLPIAITDRLSGGALVAIVLLGSAVVYSVPWVFGRGRARVAKVNPARCDACQQCYKDCPYNAITMVARNDGREKYFATQAEVDPSHCVGCGICAGSCNTAGNGLNWFHVDVQRKRLEGWLKDAQSQGETPYFAIVCTESVGGGLSLNADTGECKELPGYRVLEIPCAGWLHPLTVERLVRRGAGGVVVGSCGPGECHYREGADWIAKRLNGERKPTLRTEYVDRSRIRLLAFDRTRRHDFVSAARAFREGKEVGEYQAPPKLRAGIVAAVLAALVAVAVGAASDVPYQSPVLTGSELVVTFKHPGMISENCRELTPEELEKTPVHMRKAKICDRERSSVRLKILVDGQPLREATYAPKGIWHDGSSVAVERLEIAPGTHSVVVAIGDSADLNAWQYETAQELEFQHNERRVVIFDRQAGFQWY